MLARLLKQQGPIIETATFTNKNGEEITIEVGDWAYFIGHDEGMGDEGGIITKIHSDGVCPVTGTRTSGLITIVHEEWYYEGLSNREDIDYLQGKWKKINGSWTKID